MAATRFRSCAEAVLCGLLLIAMASPVQAGRPPLRDGPVIWYEDDQRPVPVPKEFDPGLIATEVQSTVSRPIGRAFDPVRWLTGGEDGPAWNPNALGVVPNSTWFTNRQGLRDLTVEELQARYLEKVGRPTGSANAGYLKWKIRQAEKGAIPVGPVQRRRGDGPSPDFKVLPLRMETDLVTQIDEARERLGLGSRMDLFRRSLHAFLLEAGEVKVAELFAPEA